MPPNKTLATGVRRIATAAGEAIMQIYRSADFDIAHKADDSPLTAADLAAHAVIRDGLHRLTPDLPQLSEEDAEIPFETRRHWPRYWLVDPLDGTREFIRHSDEFTVNIALIEGGRPQFGVIQVPPSGVLYWGGVGLGAWKQVPGCPPQALHCRRLGKGLVVTGSRRHGVARTQSLLDRLRHRFNPVELVSLGSSLKMCVIAEGGVDLYPRLFPTCEWDTAAAQAIVEAAGGALLDLDGAPLRYNARADLVNPEFVTLGDPDFPLELLH